MEPHFNATLFEDTLPAILFTTQRQHGVMGYFAADRWASTTGKHCHEIAINPLYVGRATLIELMQTLVHEMVHCWQHCYGTPSRRAYHNRQWADKMIAVGLMPSDTGAPGGNPVGQKMGDYPLPKGRFVNESARLLAEKAFSLPWVDRMSVNNQTPSPSATLSDSMTVAVAGLDENIIAQLTASLQQAMGSETQALLSASPNKAKVKYSCPGCAVNVWGKGALAIGCEDCHLTLQEAG